MSSSTRLVHEPFVMGGGGTGAACFRTRLVDPMRASDRCAVRRCFDLSHRSLVPSGSRILFRAYLAQPAVLLGHLLVFLVCWLVVLDSFVAALAVATVVAPAIFYALTYVCLRHAWLAATREFSDEKGPITELNFQRAFCAASASTKEDHYEEDNRSFCIVITTDPGAGEEGDTIVGSASLLMGRIADEFKMPHLPQFEGTTRGLVTRVGILPEYQGCGLGKRLMQALFDEAQRRGCTELYLVTTTLQQAAISMYQNLGFIRIMERPQMPFVPLYGLVFHRKL